MINQPGTHNFDIDQYRTHEKFKSSYLFQFINAWKSERYIIFLSLILLQIFERQVHSLIFKY